MRPRLSGGWRTGAVSGSATKAIGLPVDQHDPHEKVLLGSAPFVRLRRRYVPWARMLRAKWRKACGRIQRQGRRPGGLPEVTQHNKDPLPRGIPLRCFSSEMHEDRWRTGVRLGGNRGCFYCAWITGIRPVNIPLAAVRAPPLLLQGGGDFLFPGFTVKYLPRRQNRHYYFGVSCDVLHSS
jgi:hypothetical protein